MNNEFRRKIDDHHLLLEVCRLAEKYVELMERFESPNVQEKRELLQEVARARVLDRFLRS